MTTADAQATFEIKLEDGTSGPAGSATAALDMLRAGIERDNKALGAMQKAMRNLQGATTPNLQQLEMLRAKIADKKNAIAGAQASFISLGGSFTRNGKGSKSLQDRLADLSRQTQGMPGPLSALIGRFEAMSKLVGGRGIALGLIAIVAGLTALVAATGKAIAALYSYGIAQADARRSELLHIEGLTKVRNWYGLAAGNAGEMQTAIDRVAASSALGRDKIAAYSDQLYRMGMRGENLSAALEGVAIKSVAQGEAQASMFANWAAGAARTGGNVRKLADDVKARLGGIAGRAMLSLTVQSEKQRESFAALFSGLRIENYLKSMSTVRGLLSQSTASGRALKTMLTVMLQPLVDATTKAQPIIKRFFQGMILGAQSIVIAVLKVRNWFKRTFGAPDILGGFDAQNAALRVGKVAVYLLAGGLALASLLATGLAIKLVTFLVPALWSLVTSTAALAVNGLIVAAPFLLAAAAIFAVINTGRLLIQLWKEIDFSLLGKYMWQGLVDGLTSGVAAVKAAVKHLGATSVSLFRNLIGARSPSRVFAGLGLAIPMGVSVGVNRGAPAARQSIRDMVRPAPLVPLLGRAVGVLARKPVVAPQAQLPVERTRVSIPAARAEGDAGSRAVNARTVTLTIGDVHVHSSSDKPREQARAFRRELEDILESVAFQLGAQPAGGS
jgi:hypothetical protein